MKKLYKVKKFVQVQLSPGRYTKTIMLKALRGEDGKTILLPKVIELKITGDGIQPVEAAGSGSSDEN